MLRCGFTATKLVLTFNPLLELKRLQREAMSTPIDPVCVELNDIERCLPQEVMDAHQTAVAKGAATYKDPKSGLTVFTRQAHIARGVCCGSRCRHCPFNHVKVPGSPAPKSDVALKSTVYTRTGDRGTSSLFTGERRSKSDFVFEALGTVDELSSFIGVAKESLRLDGDKNELLQQIEGIQQSLLDVGTAIASPASPNGIEAPKYNFAFRVTELEKHVDTMDATLPPITVFILPGGGMTSAHFHVCRSVCRRAERQIVALQREYSEQYSGQLADASKFVNRLSDYFFVMARFCAQHQDVPRAPPS